MAAPAAESYALKDAAEKLGRIFGKDINRKDTIDITPSLQNKAEQFRMKINSLNKVTQE
jgi:hypothetical protein